jgi:2-haloalkanoic acid dehalogenase type II
VHAGLRAGGSRDGLNRYDVITFDCYGTLIDWESGIGEWFERSAAAEGIALGRSEALAAYAEIEPAVEAETFRAYRDVLTETVRRVAKRFGWTPAPERARGLAESLPGWKPFPDTNPALERLASAGHRLGILSNVDDDLLAGTLRHFPVRFDLLISRPRGAASVEAAGSTPRKAASTTWSPAAPSASPSPG